MLFPAFWMCENTSETWVSGELLLIDLEERQAREAGMRVKMSES